MSILLLSCTKWIACIYIINNTFALCIMFVHFVDEGITIDLLESLVQSTKLDKLIPKIGKQMLFKKKVETYLKEKELHLFVSEKCSSNDTSERIGTESVVLG